MNFVSPLCRARSAESHVFAQTSAFRWILIERYRPDIDGLRAVAVLCVIIYHAWPSSLPGGFCGVDVFFVISGFLITSIIHSKLTEGTFSLAEFWGRRIRRLAPSLLVLTIATMGLAWLFEPDSTMRLFGRTASASILFSSNIFLYFKSGYFDAQSTDNIFLHTWSLGVEEQFYLIWPILLMLTHGMRRLITILVTLTALSFAANLALWIVDPTADFYLLPSRLWELSLGGLLTLYKPRLTNLAYANTLAISGLAAIAGSSVLLNSHEAYPGPWGAVPVIGTLAIIAAGRDSLPNRAFLSHPAMVYIGRISYQLYLWHWPLLVLARHAGFKSDALSVAGILAVSFAASVATSRFIERPFRFPAYKGSWIDRRAVAILSGVAALILSANLAAANLQYRFLGGPAWVEDIAAYTFDWEKQYRLRVCFLDETQDFDALAEFCTSPKKSLPKLVLWGDSHAAHLYPGLSKWASDNGVSLLQVTASGCPPIANVVVAVRPQCAEIARRTVQLISEIKPDAVVLAAYWGLYNDKDGWPNIAPESIEVSITQLHEAGIKNIVVVGPVPVWKPLMLDALIAWQKKTGRPDLPARLSESLQSDALDQERRLANTALLQHTKYVSPRSVFCNQDGCMTSILQRGQIIPITWDYGHLTDAGSQLLATAVAQSAFPKPQKGGPDPGPP
jgi:peptidoglycan/LPS O-acetylase OafA/YrhL